ncbi:hypothetical protein LPJ56_005834 [Coemansia sp. RSA 2599]|nr:hypothetical protein LPJ56_005834 [Coemansia sp. RSA 2599]
MALVKAARECFIRKCSALRCADWLEDVESIDVDKSEAVNENEAATPIVLSSSSSQSSAMASKEALRCSAKLESTNSLDSYSKDAVHREVSSAGPGTRKQTIGACPSYAKMAVDDLKRVASEFGLRTNTPRRLIEHQLKTIWEQTHRKPVSEDCAHVRSGGDVPSQNVPEALATQLRDYIRSQPAIYEPILCYRVLDFESTYAQISAAIPCKKAMLRRFFDSEGIVYTSFNN